MVRYELLEQGLKSEQGQTMAEYGVVLAVITIGIVAVIGALSGQIELAIERAIALIPSP
jgi:Flp pilus assembly pilin Flp